MSPRNDFVPYGEDIQAVGLNVEQYLHDTPVLVVGL